MQFSIRKGLFVGGVRQLRSTAHQTTNNVKWSKIPIFEEGRKTRAKTEVVSCIHSTFRDQSWGPICTQPGNLEPSFNQKIRFQHWGLGAMENSNPSSNGNPFKRRRITIPVKADEEEELDSEPLDAVLVLAGGQLAGGGVPVWVERRLDKALQLQRLNGPNCSIVCLGAGTPHRRPFLTPEGFMIHESSSCVDYLHSQGAPVSVLLKEWGSYDTIGNAFFALVQHVIPRGWRRLAVITSDFHMPRSQAIFEWVFGLQGAGISDRQLNKLVGPMVPRVGSQSQGFSMEYHGVSDEGIDESIIQARVVKEKQALESLTIVKKGINTLADFHEWFHIQHKCYNVQHQGMFGKQQLNDPALRSY